MIRFLALTLLMVATVQVSFGQVKIDKVKFAIPANLKPDTIKNKENGHYYFTVIKDIETLGVQSQGRTGTCWSFSSLSFMEAEAMRIGDKDVPPLSEMFIVRYAYLEKAIKYVRMHGHSNFNAGGAFHDIPYVIKKYGIVPQSVYTGLQDGEKKYNHAELNSVLQSMVNAIIKNPQHTLTPYWKNAINGVLDAYLGKVPQEFEYKGKKYTPKSYAKSLGLNMNNYVELTSFTHHPFYKPFVLEVEDNWESGEAYNVKIDDITTIMEYAIMHGYSVAWGSDVSEKGFSFKNGLAIVPKDEETIKVHGKDNKNYSDAGADKISDAFDVPVKEKVITQEMRQKAFDNYQTTDDHGMHITGLVKDQNGKKYFIVKNSWGTDNYADGYFYASEAYVKYKTTDFMIHKNGLPPAIRKKLGIK